MKPNWLLCAGLASTLMVHPTAVAGRTPMRRGLDSVLATAVSYCESVVTRQAGAHLPMPTGAILHGGPRTAAGVPDLVQRFASTTFSGRLGLSSPFYIQFPAEGGQLWVVAYDGMPTCDVMVTGVEGDMTAEASALAQTLGGKAGWDLVSAQAPSGMPLAQYTLVQQMPSGQAVRLRMRALAGTAAAPDGVQLELSFISGKNEAEVGRKY